MWNHDGLLINFTDYASIYCKFNCIKKVVNDNNDNFYLSMLGDLE